MEQKSFSSKDSLKDSAKESSRESRDALSREERLRRLKEKRSKSSTGSGNTTGSKVLTSVTGAEAKSAPKAKKFPQIAKRQITNRQITNQTENVTAIQSAANVTHNSSKTNLVKLTPPKLPQTPRSLAQAGLWQLLRLTIAGVGLSVIVGTLFAFWNSYSANGNISGASVTAPSGKNSTVQNPEPVGIQLKSEVAPLTAKIKQLAAAEADLSLTAMVVDLDTSSYVNINGNQAIASASMIKIPVLVAFLQDVDAGKVRLDEIYELKEEDKVTEAGDLQYKAAGTRMSYLEVLTMMMTISDNTATNVIVKRMGGKEALNGRIKSWGLTVTVMRNLLPDVEGTNTTSPQDLVNLLGMVEQGKLLSVRSRDRLMDIMRRTVTDTLLPQGLGPEARIAHKTGDIRSVVGDAGIIDMPSGKRYIATVIVKRPDNDQRANELIRQVSRAAYDQFSANNRPQYGGQPIDRNPDSNNPIEAPQKPEQIQEQKPEIAPAQP